jgi:hypothetical protein
MKTTWEVVALFESEIINEVTVVILKIAFLSRYCLESNII